VERDIMPWGDECKLRDAAQQIFKLPKGECELSQWRTATERLMLLGDDPMLPHIEITQAPHRA
jgi:hypothetical protein